MGTHEGCPYIDQLGGSMNGSRRISTMALAACAVLAGACKKGDNGGGGAPGAAPAPAAAPAAFPVANDQQATINGRVTFTGTKRPMARIDMAEEPNCAS